MSYGFFDMLDDIGSACDRANDHAAMERMADMERLAMEEVAQAQRDARAQAERRMDNMRSHRGW